MVSQDGVILVTRPDPVLHVGDTLPPKPPAFVTYLEAGERQAKSIKIHTSSPGIPQPSRADLQTLTTTAGHVPVTAFSHLALWLLILLQHFSLSSSTHVESSGFVPPRSLSKPMETWCNPMDVEAPTLLPAPNLEFGYSAHLQAVISIHHPAVGACGKEQEES